MTLLKFKCDSDLSVSECNKLKSWNYYYKEEEEWEDDNKEGSKISVVKSFYFYLFSQLFVRRTGCLMHTHLYAVSRIVAAVAGV